MRNKYNVRYVPPERMHAITPISAQNASLVITQKQNCLEIGRAMGRAV
jgi:hypothetical protein